MPHSGPPGPVQGLGVADEDHFTDHEDLGVIPGCPLVQDLDLLRLPPADLHQLGFEVKPLPGIGSGDDLNIGQGASLSPLSLIHI